MVNGFLEEDEAAEIAEAVEASGDEAAAGESDPLSVEDINNSELLKWLRKYYGDMIFSGLGAAGQDGRTVRMICRPGLTIPVLLRLEFKPNSMQLKTSGLAVYFGRWIDMGGLVSALAETMDDANGEADESGEELGDAMPDELSGLLDMLNAYADSLEAEQPAEDEATEEALEPLTLEEVREMLVDIKAKLDSFSWLQHMFFYEIWPGKVCTLRADGLENVAILDEAHTPDLFTMMDEMEAEEAMEAEAN